MSRAPYKYLDYYTYADADLYFGREKEIQRMVGEILSSRLLVLFSPSGSGKTSLINAGVRPALENIGYKTIYVRLKSEPVASVIDALAKELNLKFKSTDTSPDLYDFLKRAIDQGQQKEEPFKPLVLFLDQFEEFFIVFRDKPELRQEFIEQLAQIRYDVQMPVFVVLSLREDYFVNLHEFRQAIPSIFQNNANIHLEPFSDDEARRAIAEPLKAVKSGIEPKLLDSLVDDLKNGRAGIEPITLQLVCHALWDRKPESSPEVTLSDYESCGRAEKILNNHVSDVLKNIPKRRHGLMTRIFEALKTEDGTKRYRTLNDLQETLHIKNPRDLQRLLDKLSQLNVLHCEQKGTTEWYEFKHDFLVEEITQWIQDRKERLSKQRVRLVSSIAVLATIIVLMLAIWGRDYIRTLVTVKDLRADLQTLGQDMPSIILFNEKLNKAEKTVDDDAKLASIHVDFKTVLNNAILNASSPNLSRADSLLNLFRVEYPQEGGLTNVLADTIRQRQVRQVERKYLELVTVAGVGLTNNVLATATALLDSADVVFQKDEKIRELRTDLARRNEILQVIQIKRPEQNRVLIGNVSDRTLLVTVILQNTRKLQGAAVSLNNKKMSLSTISAQKFLTHVVPFSSNAEKVDVAIHAVAEDGIEVSRSFTFEIVRLRSALDTTLSSQKMSVRIKDFNFYNDTNPTSSGFANNFVAHRDSLVFDRATGLMWQQGGSSEAMNYEKAKEYIADLNLRKVGGFDDWRLPTLEEAMTLMEQQRKRGLYIDTIFDQKQRWIWTSDKQSASSAWYVLFFYGSCNSSHVVINSFVRAVR